MVYLQFDIYLNISVYASLLKTVSMSNNQQQTKNEYKQKYTDNYHIINGILCNKYEEIFKQYIIDVINNKDNIKYNIQFDTHTDQKQQTQIILMLNILKDWEIDKEEDIYKLFNTVYCILNVDQIILNTLFDNTINKEYTAEEINYKKRYLKQIMIKISNFLDILKDDILVSNDNNMLVSNDNNMKKYIEDTIKYIQEKIIVETISNQSIDHINKNKDIITDLFNKIYGIINRSIVDNSFNIDYKLQNIIYPFFTTNMSLLHTTNRYSGIESSISSSIEVYDSLQSVSDKLNKNRINVFRTALEQKDEALSKALSIQRERIDTKNETNDKFTIGKKTKFVVVGGVTYAASQFLLKGDNKKQKNIKKASANHRGRVVAESKFNAGIDDELFLSSTDNGDITVV